MFRKWDIASKPMIHDYNPLNKITRMSTLAPVNTRRGRMASGTTDSSKITVGAEDGCWGVTGDRRGLTLQSGEQ